MTNFLLNRGGAGKSITRAETAEAMAQLTVPLIGIMRAYEHLKAILDNEEAAQHIDASQNRTRADIGKLSEIILSTGGITPRDTASLTDDDDPAQVIRTLNESERAFKSSIVESLKMKHHYRTIAVLENLQKNTEARIRLVRDLARSRNVPVG